MTFASLASGDTLFLDANIFVYHLTAHPLLSPSCTALVKRIELTNLASHDADFDSVPGLTRFGPV